MQKRKIIYSLLAGLLAVSLILLAVISFSNASELKIIFFDIGQGDAILISQGQNQILIDGGADQQNELEKLGRYVPFWDRKIEVVIATHPDQDHIGGLVGVFKNYKVEKVIDSPAESDSQVYKNYAAAIRERGIERLKGEKGMNIRLSGAELEIIYPVSGMAISKDTNASSIVGKLKFGKNIFLLTGDFPTEKDKIIFDNNPDLASGILKVAHHGSKYSTSEEFLAKVDPDVAVISVGAGNRYGHPAPEIMERLKKRGIGILRTDEEGDIRYACKNPENFCVSEKIR